VREKPDFALINDHLDFISAQLAKRPTRRDLARTALGIIFCTAVVTTLCIWAVWH
jgi:hypothetical protein